MSKQNAAAVAENNRLKDEFRARGLALEPVWQPTPDNPELENRQLRSLLSWVDAYRATPDRAKLQALGYRFPPVEPDCEPDTDWVRFERWVNGQAVDWSFVAEYGPLKPVDELDAGQIERELTRIEDVLEARGMVVTMGDTVPDRLRYAYLYRMLTETRLEFLAPGTHVFLGACNGYCPGCFQRPWCDQGLEAGWAEDEEEGRMVCPEESRAAYEQEHGLSPSLRPDGICGPLRI